MLLWSAFGDVECYCCIESHPWSALAVYRHTHTHTTQQRTHTHTSALHACTHGFIAVKTSQLRQKTSREKTYQRHLALLRELRLARKYEHRGKNIAEKHLERTRDWRENTNALRKERKIRTRLARKYEHHNKNNRLLIKVIYNC